MDDQKIKSEVRQHYASIATSRSAGCCSGDSSCCATPTIDLSDSPAIAEADLGLSCGLPTQFAGIRPGDTVLDLGSGAGVDALRAARLVTASGRVIGVDMTPEMIERASENARKSGDTNLEFRLGEIEALPVEDNSVDVVLSNCVINLVPDKHLAFREIHRVLKPGGHFSIADIVTYGEVPPEVRQDLAAWAGCLAGALDQEAYLALIRESGFPDVSIDQLLEYDKDNDQNYGTASITIRATKV